MLISNENDLGVIIVSFLHISCGEFDRFSNFRDLIQSLEIILQSSETMINVIGFMAILITNKMMIIMWGELLYTYAKFSKKANISYPLYAYQWVGNVSFSENFAYVLNE